MANFIEKALRPLPPTCARAILLILYNFAYLRLLPGVSCFIARKKLTRESPGRPWKGKQSFRRCPQDFPGTSREPLRPPESFPGGSQRVPARAPSSPGISEGAPKLSNSVTEGPKGSLGTQICSVCIQMFIKMIGSFEAEKLRQKRQASMLFTRPRAATRGRNLFREESHEKGKPLKMLIFQCFL